MMKKVLVFIAGAMMLAAPAMAVDIPQEATQAPAYNCDYQPSCEVAPGAYGKMSSPVTSKFNLSIGGFVKLDYAYNSVNLGNSGSLAPGSGAIPKTSSQQGQADQSIFTARQSRLWFKVGGPTFLGAKTNALIEADFYGDPSAAAESPQLRMRLAYGTLDWKNTQVMFGQFWDIFGPMAMSTVDFRQAASFGTPNNPRVPQIRLTQKVNFNDNNGLKLVLGVQDPNQDANNNQVVSGGSVSGPAAASSANVGMTVNVAGQAMFVSKALGVAPGFYGMSMNSLTAGVFGLFGSQKVTGLAGGNKHVDSYGYGFYTFVPVIKSSDGKSRAMTLSLEAQAYMASNMAFSTATSKTFVGLVANPNAAKGYGLGAQMIFYPIQDLGITAGYGRRNAYNYASYNTAGAAGTIDNRDFQKSNSIVFANVAYDLNAAVRIAAEYENLNTQYGNITAGQSGTGTANIARFAAYYFF